MYLISSNDKKRTSRASETVATMAHVFDGFDWFGLARVVLVCAGALIIGVRLVDRLFPRQQRGPPRTRAGGPQSEQSGEGGVQPERNRLTPRPSEVATTVATRSGQHGSVVQSRTIEGGNSMATQARAVPAASQEYSLWRVILASSSGTLIEWYDFYIFGTLGVFIAPLFYPPGNPTIQFLVFLATFATGFAVRPFGAIFFGRIGDLIGRKYAFLVTLTLMGLSTAVIGLLPTYASIGILAPIILVLLRLLQGLALGGEYGGAATYVAEHSPDDRRGYFTSFIQTTATVGLLLSLIVILITRQTMSADAFSSYGWRIPFLLSFILVGMSIYIRLRLRESPLFAKLKEEGKSSKAPLNDSFGNRRNWKLILLALFGATAGQAVVWYTGQFYALFFLQTVLKVNYVTSYIIIAIALLIGTPFFLVFGGLSDRIGRKKIMMAGCLIAAITYVPIYMGMKAAAGPITGEGAAATAANPNVVALTLLVLIQVIYVTMVYGPIAAFLVEFFPAKIRYTSMSLPYHLGNGEFGGFTPLIAASLVFWAQNNGGLGQYAIYAGLAYPIIIALVTFVIGSLYLPETNHIRIWDEVEGGAPESARSETRRVAAT
jgi:MFS family permease